MKDWEKNKQKIKSEAVKCDGHGSTSIRYYNEKGECIGSQYKGSTHIIMLCKNCDKGSIERSAWHDYPPCSLCINSESNNQLENNQAKIKPTEKKKEDLDWSKLKKFDGKLPDKIEPKKSDEVKPQDKNNNQPSNNQILDNLQQLQVYFQVNDIQSITQQPNGDLLIAFNQANPSQNSTNQEQPTHQQTNQPSQAHTQVITNDQLTSPTSTMDKEQRAMWKNFKDYLKTNNKQSLTSQELAQAIQQQQQSKTTNYLPWIIGGGLVLTGLIGLIILYFTKWKKKQGVKETN